MSPRMKWNECASIPIGANDAKVKSNNILTSDNIIDLSNYSVIDNRIFIPKANTSTIYTFNDIIRNQFTYMTMKLTEEGRRAFSLEKEAAIEAKNNLFKELIEV